MQKPLVKTDGVLTKAGAPTTNGEEEVGMRCLFCFRAAMLSTLTQGHHGKLTNSGASFTRADYGTEDRVEIYNYYLQKKSTTMNCKIRLLKRDGIKECRVRIKCTRRNGISF